MRRKGSFEGPLGAAAAPFHEGGDVFHTFLLTPSKLFAAAADKHREGEGTCLKIQLSRTMTVTLAVHSLFR